MYAPTNDYRTETSKKNLSLTAWSLSILTYFIQCIAPFVLLGAAIFALIVQIFSTPNAEADGAILHNDRVWYAVRSLEKNDDGEQENKSLKNYYWLMKVDPASNGVPEKVTKIESNRPRIVSSEDKLFIIGNKRIAVYQNGAVVDSYEVRTQRSSRPFVYENHLAISKFTDNNITIEVFEDGQWRHRKTVYSDRDDNNYYRNIQIIPEKNLHHVFTENSDGFLHHFSIGSAESPLLNLSDRNRNREGSKTKITKIYALEKWSAAIVEGKPTVFVLIENEDMGRDLISYENQSGQWNKVISQKLQGARKLSVISTDPLKIVTNNRDGGIDVHTIENNTIVRTTNHKEGSILFSTIVLIILAYTSPFLLTILVAFLLSNRMHKHRIGIYSTDHQSATFASLTRRCLAKVIDSVLSGLPPIGIFIWFYMTNDVLIGENATLGLCTLWGIIFLFIFAGLEGASGKTPGKWILGIRVVGTDLQPCGFGSAFTRNILASVDGFFNAFVGILAIVLTKNWQRIGDMVAHTIVVREIKNVDKPAEIHPNEAQNAL